MLSYILPTRNRHDRLRRTLAALGALDATAHEAIGGGEVIVIDNASTPPIQALDLPTSLPNGLPLRILTLDENKGAAARNDGAHLAKGAGGWLLMLDDDSHPLDANHIEMLLEAPHDVAAIGAEVFLPDGSRERGGLPEVIVGCGAAIRRDAFMQVGGYDPAFEYYAEEYDLCAKLLLAGWRITHDRRFQVLHKKTSAGRDFGAIVHRLTRNNAWVMQRYAPESIREDEIAHIIQRYAAIAVKEKAACGFARGMSELAATLANQPRTPMSADLFDRFTGAAAVRHTLRACGIQAGTRVALIECGKNENVIRRLLAAFDIAVVNDEADAEALMIGTLSPGPMLDAAQRRRNSRKPALMPWHLAADQADVSAVHPEMTYACASLAS